MKWKIFFYVPNLIGYVRIILLFVAYSVYHDNFPLFALSYFISFSLDFIDGPVARALGQCSKFGGLMDMMTDRIGNLIVVACGFETPGLPNKGFLVFLVILDIVSHTLQTYQSTELKTYHKDLKMPYTILHIYYNDESFMNVTIFGHELFNIFYLYRFVYNDYSLATNLVFAICTMIGSLRIIAVFQQFLFNIDYLTKNKANKSKIN